MVKVLVCVPIALACTDSGCCTTRVGLFNWYFGVVLVTVLPLIISATVSSNPSRRAVVLDITAATTLRLTARVTLLPAVAVTLNTGLAAGAPAWCATVAPPPEAVTDPAYSTPCGKVTSTLAVVCPPPN